VGLQGPPGAGGSSLLPACAPAGSAGRPSRSSVSVGAVSPMPDDRRAGPRVARGHSQRGSRSDRRGVLGSGAESRRRRVRGPDTQKGGGP